MNSEQRSHERLANSEEVQIGSSRAFVFVVVFTVIGIWPVLAGMPPRLWAMALAAVLLLISLIRPSLLQHPNYLWYRFGTQLYRIVSPLILGLLFFLTITPIALIMRLVGKNPLILALDRSAASHRGRPAIVWSGSFDSYLEEHGRMLSFMSEFWLFLRVRKKFWLMPITVVMPLFGGLLVLTQGSTVAPFIYTIF